MIDPPPLARMAGTAALMVSIVPIRFTSTVARSASASASGNAPMWNEPPALANRMPSPPVGCDANSTAEVICSSTVTSATM